MNILVTGGAGYVGSVLTGMLLEAGHHVRVLDSLKKGGLGLLPHFANPRLEFIRGDVRDPRTVREAVRGAEAIIHLAAIVGYPACEKDSWQARGVNVDGTLNVDMARGRSQLVLFPSSLSNYGSVPSGLCTEETRPTPITLYGATKLEAEDRLLQSGSAVVFRPATAFGLSPQMRLDLLFNELVFRALKDRRLVVYQPHFMRAFIHVRDFAQAFLFAIDNAHRMTDQVYNLGHESLNLTKGDLAQRICAKIECRLEISEDGEDPDKRDYTVDFSKLRSLGFEIEMSIDDGIEELSRGLQVIEVANPFANVSHC
jgi:nucleoside-diphosphate-sugar epimerase